MAPTVDVAGVFARKVKALRSLILQLPPTVPIAKPDSQIVEVFKRHPVPADSSENWEIFNRRMDILFGEETRVNGHLPTVERGRYGMDLILGYLEDEVASGHLQWEAAMPKIMRLVNEVKDLINAASVPPPQTEKSKKRKKSLASAAFSGSEASDGADKDYIPPRRSAKDDDPEPEAIFDSDGEEITEATDFRKEI
ncbi:hypothetical protein EST38_g13333, partial [Candolleomyces aberdarensis]